MKSKKGLGKGLNALMDSELNNSSLVEDLDINLIIANKNQPRTYFDEEALDELADSIKENGLIQPIVVRPEGKKFEIIAGERRWRASIKAELDSIPCIVKDVSTIDATKFAIIENVQREDLNPVEEAIAIKALMNDFSMTQEDVASTLSKSRSYIANSVRLLKLPEFILEDIRKGLISSGHGKVLLSITDENTLKALHKEILSKGLSVRELEEKLKSNKKIKVVKKAKEDKYVKEVENRLISILGTKVALRAGKNKGKIEIDYYSNDDLDRILQLLGWED